MPGWAGSCWYYLRYMDPTNDTAPFSVDAESYWGNVDLYVGGTEHAVLHLLYARFWHKFLFDQGVVKTKEPFQRLFNQGMVTAFAYKGRDRPQGAGRRGAPRGRQGFLKESGEELEPIVAKMSKTLKNVVNPDDVCSEYGVDAFRLYEMFMGPLGESKPWNPRDVPGCRRFLDRAWKLFVDPRGDAPVRAELTADRVSADEPSGDSLELERAWNKALKRVDDSFEHFNFNTAIAAFMSFVNDATKLREAFTASQAERFVPCFVAVRAPRRRGALAAPGPFDLRRARALARGRRALPRGRHDRAGRAGAGQGPRAGSGPGRGRKGGAGRARPRGGPSVAGGQRGRQGDPHREGGQAPRELRRSLIPAEGESRSSDVGGMELWARDTRLLVAL